MTRIDMNKVKKRLDDVRFNKNQRKSGRTRIGRPPVIDVERSKVDFERICKELGFGDIPTNISEMSLVDLWNSMTDYYLPRLDDRDKPLRKMSKPVQDRIDELELWRDIGIKV